MADEFVLPEDLGLTMDQMCTLVAEQYLRAATHALEADRPDAALAILTDYQDEMTHGRLEDYGLGNALDYALSKIAWIDDGRPDDTP